MLKPAVEPIKSHIAFFQQHVVPLYLHLTRSGQDHAFIITTFALSVGGQWLLVTAGHCIKDVDKMLSMGWQIEKARLIDTMGIGAKFRQPIPFDFLGALPTAPFKNDKNDYGLIFVDDSTRALLEANGVVAITEQAWDCDLGEPDGYFLTGVVGNATRAFADGAKLTVAVVGVKELASRPACFEDTDALRWYGEAMGATEIVSLVGTSGGPVFALKLMADGQLKYWLHGIQSAQSPRFPSEPFVAVNLARPLARFLAEVQGGHHEVGRDAL